MSLATVLQYMYPGADMRLDIVVAVDADGTEYIQQWLDARQPPTQAEITAATEAATVAAARAAIKPVTRRQMKLALHATDMLSTIEAAVAAADLVTQISYNESLEFERDNPILNAMAQALGKSDAEVDAIFALAATL